MKQVGAVADFTLLSAGSTRFCGACWLDEDDELLDPASGGGTHAGTTSVSIPVLAGSTSCWS